MSNDAPPPSYEDYFNFPAAPDAQTEDSYPTYPGGFEPSAPPHNPSTSTADNPAPPYNYNPPPPCNPPAGDHPFYETSSHGEVVPPSKGSDDFVESKGAEKKKIPGNTLVTDIEENLMKKLKRSLYSGRASDAWMQLALFSNVPGDLVMKWFKEDRNAFHTFLEYWAKEKKATVKTLYDKLLIPQVRQYVDLREDISEIYDVE